MRKGEARSDLIQERRGGERRKIEERRGGECVEHLTKKVVILLCVLRATVAKYCKIHR